MTTSHDETTPATLSRRRMLMRLGLAASALYAAPVLLQLSEARASGFTRASFSRGGKRGKSAADGRRRKRHAVSFSGGRRRGKSFAASSRRRKRKGFSG